MRWFKGCLLFAFTLAALAVPVAKQFQYGGAGGVEGTVFDQAGVPVMQAKVQVCNVFTGGCMNTLSENNGFYRIAGLAAGRYSLWAEASRHASVWMPMIIIEEGKMTRLDIQLSREIPTSTFQ